MFLFVILPKRLPRIPSSLPLTTSSTKNQDRRLSRKRSHVSLDRMRRSMSLETCRVADHQDGGITSGLFAGRGGSDGDRQTSSLKLRCNPPETIPEEEMERIRRESLVPHVGLLAGDGRRRSSAVGLDGGGGGGGGITANNKAPAPKAGGKPDDGSVSGPGSRAGGRRSSTAVFSGGFKSAANAVLLPKPPEKASVFSKTAPATSSAAQKNSNNNLLSTTEIGRVSAPSPSTGDILSSTVFSDDIITLMAEDKHQGEDEGRAGSEASSCYSQRRDEGLGESFDRYSEISGYGNCSGGAGETLIELHTLNTNPGSSSAKPPSPPSSSSSSLSGTTKNSLQGQPIPGFPLDSTPLSAYPERPHQSPKNRNNNISKRKVSSSTSAPGEVRRKKSEDNSPDSDKAFVGVSRSLPLEGGEDSDHESSGGENGIDPLFFLSELQSKRVTFM
ncbi:hypothetical protein RRG08_040372 [Elysia crispata]|uniref:Uncharacterized protein n=1 Tax=Elysia crispata TaxID=231223 RepID=A0AAE1A1J3_9GAST|nr:hypothetical protein RRG08_040372 [Elysia crispata]